MRFLPRASPEVRLKKFCFHSLLIGLSVLVTVPMSAWAQVTASISGKVEDASSAGVQGASVTVKSLETGATRIVTTDDAGNFRVLSVPIGPQQVRAEKTGFKTEVRSHI